MEATTLGSGRVKLVDPTAPAGSPLPEDLDLEKVLGDMPKKTYDMKRMPFENDPVKIPDAATASEALDRVLQLPSVCSKRLGRVFCLFTPQLNPPSLVCALSSSRV